MPLKAAFFDVGDTLVEHWAPREVMGAKMRERVCAEFGDAAWVNDLIAADIEPPGTRSAMSELRRDPTLTRQETNAWYEAWLRARGIDATGIDIDRLRARMCVPLDEISVPATGAFDAVRWSAARGLRIVLVTNTLSRGDAEALDDWRRFGLGETIHGVVSSHSVGWRKPHRAIFERALTVAGVAADEAFHVGDNLVADVWGAQQVGLRAVWRRTHRTHVEEGPLPRDCDHPSELLFEWDRTVRCRKCGGMPGTDIEPDAVIDEMTELAGVVEPWLEAAA